MGFLSLIFLCLVFCSCSLAKQYRHASYVSEAVTVLRSTTGVQGMLMFRQRQPHGQVYITGTISGLTPGNHGFHIHQFGNLIEGCASTGGHFNPFRSNHGGPRSRYRHVGDLGNIYANADGMANVRIFARLLSLNGPTSIIGRGIVVHADPDDLGRGGDMGSMTTGNAGDRVACGIIGVSQEKSLQYY